MSELINSVAVGVGVVFFAVGLLILLSGIVAALAVDRDCDRDRDGVNPIPPPPSQPPRVQIRPGRADEKGSG